ncbi:MAG: hypothetical protein PHG36_04095 [Dehalococcoidia bacterium]|nr:hypothetical protein [Dehalococcoidia bacterium]
MSMSAGEKAKWQVRLRSRLVRWELDGLNGEEYRKVIQTLKSLAVNPQPKGCEKIYDDIYHMRIGDIIVTYCIDALRKQIDVGAIRRLSTKTF